MMGPLDAAWLATAIGLTAPILFAAMGELVAERAGIFNIGLEGMMLVGAFAAFVTTWQTGSIWLGIVVGLSTGMTLAMVMAFLSIEANADQVVVGVGLNILAFGVTTFAFDEIFSGRPQVLLEPMAKIAIPVLSDLPHVGDALFHQAPLAYLAYVAVPGVWFLLYKTSWGLSLRAAGELPEAVDTAGVSVRKVRWVGTLTAGAMAGLGGAFLSVVSIGLFIQGMSAGRGFIALAAVIFGGWRPFGVFAAALVFGSADALQLRLQAEPFIPRQVWLALAVALMSFLAYRMVRRRLGTGLVLASTLSAAGIVLFARAPEISLPSQMWLALPFVLAIVVLASFVGRKRMPTALAVPLRRGAAV